MILMKNIFMLILTAVFTLMITSCVNTVTDVLTPILSDTSTQSSCSTSTTQDVNANYNNERIPEQDLIYKNLKFNYQLIFPKSWFGWYIIDEYDNGSIKVSFFGKSKTGTISLKEFDVDGLPMFSIMGETQMKEEKELEVLDSIKEIGIVNGIKYYYTTGTSVGLGALSDIVNADGTVRHTVKYLVCETELKLAKEDWEKAQGMQGEIDEILKTFKTIDN